MITRKTKGCLTVVLLAIGLLIFLQWLALQPSQHADSVQEKIHIGMNTLEIERFMPAETFYMLTGRSYTVQRSGEWKKVSREEFSDAIKTPKPDQPHETKLWLTFYGPISRAAIVVHSDGAGRVVSVERPHFGR